jgi:hypothetical protein
MADQEIALLLYGNGADLGNFRFFADDLATALVQAKKFTRTAISINQTLNRTAAFTVLSGVASSQKIKELHIFSHSIGAGLYVGYHEATAGANRMTALNAANGAGRNITYEEIVLAETGGILTDHLVRDPLGHAWQSLKPKFAAGATAKLWGCNSGVSGWIYSDTDTAHHTLVYAQDAPADVYYWRALNLKNVPKPSIAQALANTFGVTVFGAGSGSHIEVRYQRKWITSGQYKTLTGRFAGEPETLRLNPDVGDYNSFTPATGP